MIWVNESVWPVSQKAESIVHVKLFFSWITLSILLHHSLRSKQQVATTNSLAQFATCAAYFWIWVSFAKIVYPGSLATSLIRRPRS